MNLDTLKQNCVGLSITIQEHSKYSAFYDANGPKYGGFPGIWREIGNVAGYLTEVEAELGDTCWDDKDWIGTLDEIAEWFLDSEYTTEAEWKEAIKFTIENPT